MLKVGDVKFHVLVFPSVFEKYEILINQMVEFNHVSREQLDSYIKYCSSLIDALTQGMGLGYGYRECPDDEFIQRCTDKSQMYEKLQKECYCGTLMNGKPIYFWFGVSDYGQAGLPRYRLDFFSPGTPTLCNNILEFSMSS